jgi:hypothetical protein
MGIRADLKDAVEQGRDDVVGVLAAYRVLPAVVEAPDGGGSNLLGGSKTPDFSFERQFESERERVADRQTRARVVDALGLASEDDCEAVREEIRAHDDWGANA